MHRLTVRDYDYVKTVRTSKLVCSIEFYRPLSLPNLNDALRIALSLSNADKYDEELCRRIFSCLNQLDTANQVNT